MGFRRPSESWDPVTLGQRNVARAKSLGPSFRWGDGLWHRSLLGLLRDLRAQLCDFCRHRGEIFARELARREFHDFGHWSAGKRARIATGREELDDVVLAPRAKTAASIRREPGLVPAQQLAAFEIVLAPVGAHAVLRRV